jgi:predicted nucleic acid-binding protein
VILVDSSVWVEFFKGTARSRALADLLEADEVLLHPWVLGELVLGGLARGHDARSRTSASFRRRRWSRTRK